MAQQLLNNIKISLQESPIMQNISDKIGEIRIHINNLPNILGQIETNSERGFFELKNKLGKKLKSEKKKFKLALESLGWGGIAAFLESAFAGEKLNLFA